MRKFTMFLIGAFLVHSSGFANELYSHPKFANSDIRFEDNFVSIKAGSFYMGFCAGVRVQTSACHRVIISKSFEMQSTVVTQGQFYLVQGHNPSFFRNKKYCKNDHIQINGTDLCPNNPVESISWNDTQDFISKLNTIDSQYQYRLPNEAEWEYSADRDYYWYMDESNLSDYIWYLKNSGGHTHAVGTKPANTFGLYDMLGNVYQWVQDWYGDYASTLEIDPVGPASGTGRVFRGSYFDHTYGTSGNARVVNMGIPFRNSYTPGTRRSYLGFRLVRTAK